jgi:putative redox protein
MSTMIVRFPGGKRVDAEYGGFTVRTDQAREAGGDASAPAPFDLFLASIATCAGIYVKGFCDSRGIATEGLGLGMRVEREPSGPRIIGRP